jgi:hypothetical protein
MNSPAQTYAPSFCFLNNNTVAHVNLRDRTIETRKILRKVNGAVWTERSRVFKIPLVTTNVCQLKNAQWSGDYPSIPVASRPMVWPELSIYDTPRSSFRTSLKSSILSLTLYYSCPLAEPGQRDRVVRIIIPRSELLASQGDWKESSFRMFSLDEDARGVHAISGTRWITKGLEVFDFNDAHVRSALASRREDQATIKPGVPNPMVEVTDIMADGYFKRDVPSSLPYCHTIPINQPKEGYDDILADDEHVVGIRYEVRCAVVCLIFYMRSDENLRFQYKQIDDDNDDSGENDDDDDDDYDERTMDLIVDVWKL